MNGSNRYEQHGYFWATMEFEFGETAVDSKPCLETIRALHQTVVALRAALEQSRNEILELKQRAWPVETTLRNLSIENHVLRNTVLRKTEDVGKHYSNNNQPGNLQEGYEETQGFIEQANISPKKHVKIITPPRILSPTQSDAESQISSIKEISVHSKSPEIHSSKESINETEHFYISTPELKFSEDSTPREFVGNTSNLSKNCNHDLIEISIAIDNLSSRKISKSLENLTVAKTPIKNLSPIKNLGISKTLSFSNIPSTVGENLDMAGNYARNSVDDSSFGHVSPGNITPLTNAAASPRHNMLPTCTIQSQLNASSSPNISQMTQSAFQNSVLSNSATLENAQSEPALQNASHNEMEQNEEVDDIELIFTTEETKDSDFKEELVPIDNSDIHLQDVHNNRVSIRFILNLKINCL